MKLTTFGVPLMVLVLVGCTDRARERVSSLVERSKSVFAPKNSKVQSATTQDLLAQLTSWDAIGMSLAYVQQMAGPAERSQDHQYHFKVQGCELVLKSDQEDKAIRSVQVSLTSGCSVDVGGLMGLSQRQPLSALTFGAFDNAMGSAQHLADCLRDCGNAYVPKVYLVAQGSRALRFKEVMLTAELATDPVIQAAGQWADVMVEKESEDWVVKDLAFNCQPQKYRDVAAQALRTLKPDFLSFGDGLEFPTCPTAETTASSEQKAGPMIFPAGMVLVPQPDGQCDMNYGKRLQAVGLKANEVSVHGPEDEDFKGYGCAYRVTPALGSSVPAGSTVTYRSAWELG